MIFLVKIFIPEKGVNGEMENVEWEIVKPNENGRIKCFDCPKTFYCMYYAKIHQYKCSQVDVLQKKIPKCPEL